MKFLILTPDFPCWDGGVAAASEKFAEWLARAGHEVTVFTPRQTERDAEFDKTARYKIFRGRNVKDRYLKFFYAHWKVRKLLAEKNFDHILCVTWFPFANAALRFAPRTPLTVFAYGNDFLETRWQKNFWRGRMERAFNGATRVMAGSHETERVLRKTFPDLKAGKIKVLFPAVDPDEFPFTAAPQKPPVLLTLGRVVARKGQDMVIRALPKILQEFPETEYRIAGRGSDMERLKNLAAELNVSGRVKFLGLVSPEKRIELYQQSTIYLMPSRTHENTGDFEGFGITFLEANACGRAVIGGRSGGVADAVIDGETGFLVDPQSPDDVAEKTLKLLRDPALATEIGRRGRERIEREFNWEITVKRLLELL